MKSKNIVDKIEKIEKEINEIFTSKFDENEKNFEVLNNNEEFSEPIETELSKNLKNYLENKNEKEISHENCEYNTENNEDNVKDKDEEEESFYEESINNKKRNNAYIISYNPDKNSEGEDKNKFTTGTSSPNNNEYIIKK